VRAKATSAVLSEFISENYLLKKSQRNDSAVLMKYVSGMPGET